MFMHRIIVVAIGIPLVFSCIYYCSFLFYCMMFLVSLLSVYEYFTILKKYRLHILTPMLMSSTFFILLYFFKNCSIDKIVVSAVAIMIVLFIIEIFNDNTNLSIARISLSFFGCFFIPLTMMHMVYIRNLKNGIKLTIFVFVVVWTLDTAAYVFGKFFGKHSLAKNISSKKTIEGAVAGIIFGIICAISCKYIFMNNIFTLFDSIVLGFIIAIIGQFSDLCESVIKRDGNVKDSSKILPGHGGIFDRFDSYMFTAPVVYYIFKLLI